MNNPTRLATVLGLSVLDIGNAGNGSDVQVSFSKISNETNVSEYRIFIVKSSESGTFNLEKAVDIAPGNFIGVPKTGANFSMSLSDQAKTVDGELIANAVAYRVYVMTVSNDLTQFLNALSGASSEFTLVDTDKNVKVTYIANDGILIEYQDKKVAIDAINVVDNLNGWISPSSTVMSALQNGIPPYDNIDVIMVTHGHGDHYATSAIQSYLSRNSNTKLIVPNGLRSSFGSNSNRIPNFSINKFEQVELVLNDITIDVLQVEHFNQFGNNFADVESYTYIVHMGGKKFMHAGDIDYTDSQLDKFNLLQDSVTVAFIPTFGDLVSPRNRDALIDNVNPKNIVGLHFLRNSLSTSLSQLNSIYPEADAFTEPLEIRVY